MSLANWIPSVLATGLLGFILWLSRTWIATRLAAAVAHEYDGKLEQLRAELRSKEEEFKADLHAKEVEFAALRDGALTSMTSRQAAVAQRRLEAVDRM